jgi:hypothetical protein
MLSNPLNLGPIDFWIATDVQSLDKGDEDYIKPERDGERMFDRHNRGMEEKRVMEWKRRQKEQKKNSVEREPNLVIHEEVYDTVDDTSISHPAGRVEKDTLVRRPGTLDLLRGTRLINSLIVMSARMDICHLIGHTSISFHTSTRMA